MRGRRIAAVFALPLALAMCTACGKKKQVTISLAESSSVMELHSSSESAAATGTVEARPEDIVNGYRFSGSNQIVYCKAEESELRDRPGTDGTVAGKAKRGEALRCTAVNVRWLRFDRNGKIVYGAAEDFETADHSAPGAEVQTEHESAEVGVAPH